MSQYRIAPRWAYAAGALAVLGASAYYVNRKRLQVEAENPPQGRFIKVDDVNLHYTEHGDPQAPVLVVLHGMGATSTEIELSGLVERAQNQYHVLVFDRPGYGHSDRPAGRIYTPEAQARLFLQALEQLGVERPVVLAHSWATLIAISMAAQAPGALKGLVLLSGYYTPSLRLDVLLNSVPAIPVIGHLMAHTLSPLIARAMWGALQWRVFSPAPKAVRQSFSERYPKWMSLRPHTLRAAAAENAMLIPEALRQRAEHPQLELPVVIVAGESDRLITTRWHSQRVQDRFPNSHLHVVPGAGHMVHHADPDAVFQAVREVSSMVTAITPVPESTRALAPEDAPLQQAYGMT
jgi:pimeloyl-ACP methyl ester carboxylesterase